MRILVTTPGWAAGRTGTAAPAFGRGRYHVRLDGDGLDRLFYEHELESVVFTRRETREMVRVDGGRL
jgi:hypothetical protein